MPQQAWTTVSEAPGWTPVAEPAPPPSPFTAAGGARIGPPSPNKGVTLADLQANPADAMRRIGTILGREATDPALWGGLIAAYFGPAAAGKILPMLGRAGRWLAAPAAATVTQVTRRIGIDPAAMEKQIATQELQATRMRLQAAKSRTRQGRITAKIEQAKAAPEAAVSAVEESPALRSENAIVNYGKASGIEVKPSDIVIGDVEPDPAALDNYARSQQSRIIRLFGPSGKQVVGPGSRPSTPYQAKQVLAQAARAAKVTLNGPQTEAGVKAILEGESAPDVVDTLTKRR